MKRVHKGSAAAAMIIGLGVLIAGGVIWYCVSDVFHTKVNAAADQYTHWTPENIAKDPVNYLNFCEDETKKAVEGLKADEIAVAQNTAKLQAAKDDADNKVSLADKALSELKVLWQQNDSAAATWPVVWHEKSLEKDDLKRQVKSLSHERDIQAGLSVKVDNGLKTLDAQKTKIADARAKAAEQLSEIAANRQLLSVQKITDDLTNRLVAMKGALQATVATASDSKGTVSLEALAADSAAAAPSDTEFDKILTKVK